MEAKVESAGVGPVWGNFAFILFLILILLVFGIGFVWLGGAV